MKLLVALDGSTGSDAVLREVASRPWPAGSECCVLTAIDPGEMRLRQSFAVFETLLNEPSRVFLCGRCYDRVVDEGGVLRFVERVCVADATLVPVSLVFPI